jgi:glycosyltransferase involved in cell wall biosynthesis
MRIGMVLANTFPPDIRVSKEARVLIAAGHQVHLLAQERASRGEAAEEEVEGIAVQRVPHRPTLFPVLCSFRNACRWTFSPVDRHWAVEMEQYVRRFSPDVLHVHDLPLVGTAVSVGKRHGIPVIADLHENMPAANQMGRASLSPLKRLVHAIVCNDRAWRWYEQQILPHCARVMVVVPEAMERLVGGSVDPARIVVVSNTEDETTFPPVQPAAEIVDRYRGLWVISYVGSIGPHRGVDTAIRAMPLLAADIPNVRLVLVGAKQDNRLKALQRLVEEVQAGEQVEIVGWQPFDRVGSFVDISAACLVPHNDSEHTQTTVPHKLFQYMIARKPVIVSDVRPLRRIVEETRAGLVFEAGNPASLAHVLLDLYRRPEVAAEMALNGHRAATGDFSWQHDARRLLRLYEELEGEIKRGGRP